MQKRTAAALVLLGPGLALAVLARFAAPAVLTPLAGLLIASGAALGLSALPIWPARRPPRMPGLFERPRAGQRWCASCGRPAPPGPCPRCRTEGRKARRARRLQEEPPAAPGRKP